MVIIDELKLIEKVKQGNEKAFEVLINNYKNYIYTLCYGVIKNHQDALDLSQEVFIKVYFSISAYRDQGFKAWISKIAINLSIDHVRKLKKISSEEYVESSKMIYDDVEENVLNSINSEKIQTIYNSLPKKYSEILKKYYFENKSYSCISVEENISVKTVETRLYRAKKILKEKWGDDLYGMLR